MATSNPVITPAWAKIVTAGDDFTLGIPHGAQSAIAVAAWDTDEAPTVAGQPLQSSSEAVNRALTGPGYIYARSLTGAAVIAWLHVWNNFTLLLFGAGTWDTSLTWLNERTWG